MHRLYQIMIIVLTIPLSPIVAQQDAVMDLVTNQLHQMVEAYVQESFLTHQFTTDLDGFEAIFTPKSVDSLRLQTGERVRRAEIEMLKKDPGLNLQTSYTNNLAGAILDEDGFLLQCSCYRWSKLGLVQEWVIC